MKKVKVKPGLSKKEGIKKIIKKALRDYGGDSRAAGYDPKTGEGWVN